MLENNTRKMFKKHFFSRELYICTGQIYVSDFSVQSWLQYSDFTFLSQYTGLYILIFVSENQIPSCALPMHIKIRNQQYLFKYFIFSEWVCHNTYLPGYIILKKYICNRFDKAKSKLQQNLL